MKTVLVVDDNEINRDTLRIMLSSVGWEVKIAINGEKALSLIAEGGIDIILSDYKMEPVNGLDLYEAIKNKNIPFVLITGSQYAWDMAEKLGITLIKKPYDFKNLLQVIRCTMRAA